MRINPYSLFYHNKPVINMFIIATNHPYNQLAFHFNQYSMYPTEPICVFTFSPWKILLSKSWLPSLWNVNYSNSLSQNTCIVTPKKPWPLLNSIAKKKQDINIEGKNEKVPRIAIVGGGLCGVTAAKAIASRVPTSGPEQAVDITIFESDLKSFDNVDKLNLIQECSKPLWKAAAARNANSIVPGAAMHIMSQRSTMKQILNDFIGIRHHTVFNRSPNDDFTDIPPYFGFSAWKCIGLPASWEERMSFMLFMFHFLKTSLFSSEHDVRLRGKYLVQLASSNRFALAKEIEAFEKKQNKRLIKSLSLNSGFISVHRTKDKAEDAVQECQVFGEDAEILSYQSAVELEPHIQYLPIKDAFYVHRPNDKVGNCYEFMIENIKSLIKKGVRYENNWGRVRNIERNENGSFLITTDNGCHEYDYIILANGIFTPLLAGKLQLRASRACPTYPLKGYSLTLIKRHGKSKSSEKRINKEDNLLKKAMSFDNLYCTSISPNMVRLAGFGELSGFPNCEDDYTKSPGLPINVMQKYVRAIFGDTFNFHPDLVSPCYRPLSPDDLPLVGAVKSIPGLYFHTGHGTLGWTLCLATADCLAQSICDEILSKEHRCNDTTDSFTLPDGTRLPKSVLSPNRFL